MKQYIDKDKLLLELTRRLESYKEEISKFTSKYLIADIIAKEEECKELISFLDTLEVKEVDLDKEIKNWLSNGPITDTRYDDYDDRDIERTAKHFFELGLKAQKGK